MLKGTIKRTRIEDVDAVKKVPKRRSISEETFQQIVHRSVAEKVWKRDYFKKKNYFVVWTPVPLIFRHCFCYFFFCHKCSFFLSSFFSFVLLLWYIDLRLGQICHSKDGRSCIFRWRWRAWLTIWDRVKIPRYSHKLIHRRRITCELHDSYFHSMMIKTCMHSKDGGSYIFCWLFMGRF